MRRTLSVFAAVGALAIAGCGGSSGTSKPSDPLSTELSYFPAGAPLVAVGETDVKAGQLKAALDLIGRFPGSSLLLGRLRDEITSGLGKVDAQRDLLPLLGNPVVLGAPDAASLSADDLPLAVFVASDADKLAKLVSSDTTLSAAGEHKGAKLYTSSSGGAAAVDGATFVLASDKPTLTAALDRHEAGSGLDPDALGRGIAGVPREGLVRVYGDLGAILRHDRSTAKARKVPWIAALGRFAAVLSVDGDGADLDASVDTSDGNLADGDVPIATGGPAVAPPVAAPIDGGLRDLAHVIDFAQRAAKSVDPAAFAQFSTAKDTIRTGAGLDLDRDIADQLDGSTLVATDLRATAVVAELRDPKAMAATLQRATPIVPAFLSGAGLEGVTVRPDGSDYVLVRGEQAIARYGVGGGDLVVAIPGKGTSVAARAAAVRSGAKAVPGAKGALSARVDAQSLAPIVADMAGVPEVAVAAFLRPLQGLTAWAGASTGAFEIHAHAAVG